MKKLKEIGRLISKSEQGSINGGLRRCNNGTCKFGFCCQGLCVPDENHWAYNRLCLG